MSGRHSRTKGASGERELCALLSDEFGLSVKRKLGQARDSGHDVDLPGFAVEVKRRKAIAGLYQWLGQCVPDVGPKPVVMVRADGEQWLAVMYLRDWCELAREEIAK